MKIHETFQTGEPNDGWGHVTLEVEANNANLAEVLFHDLRDIVEKRFDDYAEGIAAKEARDANTPEA